MMAILIVLGCLMDWIGICLLTRLIFVPIIKALGYGPICFGVLFCISMHFLFLAALRPLRLLSQGRGAARHLTERDLLRALAMYGAPGRLDRHRHPVPAAGSLAAGPEPTPGRHP